MRPIIIAACLGLAACAADVPHTPAVGVGGVWNTQDHQAAGGAGNGPSGASSGGRGASGNGRGAASGGMGRGS